MESDMVISLDVTLWALLYTAKYAFFTEIALLCRNWKGQTETFANWVYYVWNISLCWKI